ncbi:MAG: hypothetical protein IJC43_04025 [Clostridia bacterium]|nr:hypothetical protein [Clostridia bacterium]
MENSVKTKVFAAAVPYLEGLTVTDLVIGISLLAVELSDGSLGVSYVQRHDLPAECSAFAYAQDAIGAEAAKIARWSVEGEDNIARAIGGAVLTAASHQLSGIENDDDPLCRYGMQYTKQDIVGMIGYIRPVAKTIADQVEKLIVFDEGIEHQEGAIEVCPMARQSELLPLCTRMVITGSATVNNSIDGLLKMCSGAEQIALVGCSTPMFPEGWKDTKVTALAGAWWPKEKKEEIFRIISRGGGISLLRSVIQHKIALVK